MKQADVRVTHVLHGGPGAGDERAGAAHGWLEGRSGEMRYGVPGAGDTRAGVDTTDPVGVDVVLEAAEVRVLVHDHRVTLQRREPPMDVYCYMLVTYLGRETVLVDER